MNGIYSSRAIEHACKPDVRFTNAQRSRREEEDIFNIESF